MPAGLFVYNNPAYSALNVIKSTHLSCPDAQEYHQELRSTSHHHMVDTCSRDFTRLPRHIFVRLITLNLYPLISLMSMTCPPAILRNLILSDDTFMFYLNHSESSLSRCFREKINLCSQEQSSHGSDCHLKEFYRSLSVNICGICVPLIFPLFLLFLRLKIEVWRCNLWDLSEPTV